MSDIVLTRRCQQRLVAAIDSETNWSRTERDELIEKVLRVPVGTPLVDDLTDVAGDGETDIEVVSVAISYFWG